jgi:hypothetical protein
MPAPTDNFKPITYDDIYDEELENEYMGKVRKIVIENGNHVWIESVDPYGHWKISLKKGKLPDHLKDGSWTTFRDALTAVNIWLKERKVPIVYQTTKDKVSREE